MRSASVKLKWAFFPNAMLFVDDKKSPLMLREE